MWNLSPATCAPATRVLIANSWLCGSNGTFTDLKTAWRRWDLNDPESSPKRWAHYKPAGNRFKLDWIPAGTSQGGSKVRPVEGRSCAAALKSEDRRPKPERRPKSEFREWPNSIGGCSAGVAINSDFGLRSSELGFGMARTDFRAALRSPVSNRRVPG